MDTFVAPRISLLVVLGLLTLLAYKSWLSYEQEKVCICVDASLYGELTYIDQELRRLEVERNCARPRLWAAKWPLGLDLLLKAFWHGQNRTVCEFFWQVSEQSGPTHEQRLCRLLCLILSNKANLLTVGARNIGTTSPKNLKVVLDTQHKGSMFPIFRIAG
jgi:hypothetical protein